MFPQVRFCGGHEASRARAPLHAPRAAAARPAGRCLCVCCVCVCLCECHADARVLQEEAADWGEDAEGEVEYLEVDELDDADYAHDTEHDTDMQ